MIEKKRYCNKCSKNISDNINGVGEGLSINQQFNYGSKYDCASIQLDLCDVCLTELFEILQIDPFL